MRERTAETRERAFLLRRPSGVDADSSFISGIVLAEMGGLTTGG
jgi:hypothetical protein